QVVRPPGALSHRSNRSIRQQQAVARGVRCVRTYPAGRGERRARNTWGNRDRVGDWVGQPGGHAAQLAPPLGGKDGDVSLAELRPPAARVRPRPEAHADAAEPCSEPKRARGCRPRASAARVTCRPALMEKVRGRTDQRRTRSPGAANQGGAGSATQLGRRTSASGLGTQPWYVGVASAGT
ncbi:hypothetical protein BAE44_0016156, partial [Dichanthelium oligosanthes]